MSWPSWFDHLDALEAALTRRVHPDSLSGALFYLLLFLLLGLVLDLMVRRALRAARLRDTHQRLDPMSLGFLQGLASVAIWVVVLVAYAHLIPALRNLGTALLAGASVVSIVVGLAAQNTLGNLVSGLSLLLYRPFRVGDRLQVSAPTGVESGTVESLSLGYTVLRTYDNRRIVLPNSGIANQVTINLSSIDPKIMVIVPVGIAYGADIDRAREVLIGLARAHREVIEPISCPVVNLGASSVDLSLRTWCADAAAAARIKAELLEAAAKALPQAGIEIPFPTTTVWLRRDGARD
jgi:small-conductance mechanosensitive channel